MKENIEMLNNKRAPPGTQPYDPGYSHDLLAMHIGEEAIPFIEYTVKIPFQTNVFQTKEILYFAHAKWQKEIDVKLWEKHGKNLEEMTNPKDFAKRCDDAISGRADFDFLKHSKLKEMNFEKYYDKIDFEEIIDREFWSVLRTLKAENDEEEETNEKNEE